MTLRLLLSTLATLLVAGPVLAWQPCPPGTSPWTFWAVVGFWSYVALASAGVGVLARAAFRARSAGKRLAFAAAILLALILVTGGGLALVIRVSWSGTCV